MYAKNTHGLIASGIDLICAGMLRIEVHDLDRAQLHLREAIGHLMEAKQELDRLLKDLEEEPDDNHSDVRRPAPSPQLCGPDAGDH
jgi:hypothetical protein